MKTCWKCGTVHEDDATHCMVCGEALKVEELASEAKKPVGKLWRGVKHLWPYSFSLLPAVLMLIYDSLLWFGFIPSRFQTGSGKTVNLLEASQSGAMVLLSVLVFVILPAAFLLVTAYTYWFRWQDARTAAPCAEMGGAEMVKTKKAKKGKKTVESEKLVAAPASVCDDPIAEHEAAVAAAEEVKSLSSEVFAYRKLLEMDATVSEVFLEDCAKSFTLSSLVDGFCAFAASRGLSVSADVSRTLFAALGASRKVCVADKSRELTEKLLAALAAYLGGSVHLSHADGAEEACDLLLPKDADARYESALLCDIYEAKFRQDAMCFAALDCMERKCSEEAVAPLLQYSGSQNRYTLISMPRQEAGSTPRYLLDDVLRLPTNLWIFLRVRSAEKDAMPHVGITVDLSSVAVGESGSGTQMGCISYTRFMELVASAKLEKYIPEEYWKKLDGLEQYIAKRIPYALDNKTVRHMEAYAAVYMSCGGELDALLDRLVAYVMLPALSRCPKDLLTGETDGLATALDRLFGLERMPQSCECMKRMGVN